MSTLVADIALVVRLVNTARALQLIGNNMRVEGKYSTFLSPNMPAALKVAANKTQYSEQVCWHTGADAAHVDLCCEVLPVYTCTDQDSSPMEPQGPR